jgi:hypothetical protein
MTKLTFSIAAALLFMFGAAAAQDYPTNTAPSVGMPGPEAVNPAPDARGQPYLGVGMQNFYDPMDREQSLQHRLEEAASSGAMNTHQVHQVQAALDRVIAEDRTQMARHGGLRDWDRERLNDMMNHIVERYPELRS